MNTAGATIPYLKKVGIEHWEYPLEHLELAFLKSESKEIVQLWNDGTEIDLLAKQFERKPEEIFLLIFDKSLKGKGVRPFAFRYKS